MRGIGMIRWWLVLVLGVGCCGGSAAVERAPKALLDRGACPFECCRYGQWTATRRVPLLAAAREGGRRVGWIAPGSRVQALDGFVRTIGQPFRVHRAHAGYRPGETLMVYTYQGEGSFRIWRAGRWQDEDLGFSPYGGTGGTRCADDARCWGTLAAPLRSDWWVRVRLPDARVGWVRGNAGFAGQDACG